MPDALTLTATTAADLQAIGERLGRALAVGDVLALVGPLGAGKTTFVQGMARGVEVAADRHVASPTFALVNEHPGRVPLVHADLYRINDPRELEELGLSDAFDRAAVAIEWLDRFPGSGAGRAPHDRDRDRGRRHQGGHVPRDRSAGGGAGRRPRRSLVFLASEMTDRIEESLHLAPRSGERSESRRLGGRGEGAATARWPLSFILSPLRGARTNGCGDPNARLPLASRARSEPSLPKQSAVARI